MASSASPRPAAGPLPPLDPETTVELLDRARAGDPVALDVLMERCVPALRRWARGRLPPAARGMLDTEDLVQDTVAAAFRRLDGFQARHQGALQAYLRQAVMNRIRDALRQQRRRPQPAALPDDLAADDTSPLERVIGAERVARYEAAFQTLRPADREAIVGRLELQYSYADLAVTLRKPTANAARVAVMRAIRRLVDRMRETS